MLRLIQTMWFLCGPASFMEVPGGLVPWSQSLPRWSSYGALETGTEPWSGWCCAHTNSQNQWRWRASEPSSGVSLGVLLAGEEPHDVPVTWENTELHQIPENAQNLQQELLQGEKLRGDEGEFQFLWFNRTEMITVIGYKQWAEPVLRWENHHSI